MRVWVEWIRRATAGTLLPTVALRSNPLLEQRERDPEAQDAERDLCSDHPDHEVDDHTRPEPCQARLLVEVDPRTEERDTNTHREQAVRDEEGETSIEVNGFGGATQSHPGDGGQSRKGNPGQDAADGAQGVDDDQAGRRPPTGQSDLDGNSGIRLKRHGAILVGLVTLAARGGIRVVLAGDLYDARAGTGHVADEDVVVLDVADFERPSQVEPAVDEQRHFGGGLGEAAYHLGEPPVFDDVAIDEALMRGQIVR